MSGNRPAAGRWSLFGPVLFWDLVREGRRSRGTLLRCGYAVVLLAALCWLYVTRFGMALDWNDLFESRWTHFDGLARFAEAVFNTFLVVQYVVVVVLTPAYTAGAIAEEKEKGTLDYLLATDLSSREIVLSKLGSRLARLLLLLLTGVPILALTPLWGGVDPQLVLAGFAATAVTMVSLAALSLLNSIYAARPIDAVLRTYFQVGAFLLVGTCIPGPNLGHPIVALMLLSDGLGSWQGRGLLMALGGYTLVHLVVAAGCVLAAVLKLRPVVLRIGGTRAPGRAMAPSSILPPLPRRLPPPSDNALLWKEMYLEQHFVWERIHPLIMMGVVFFLVGSASVAFTMLLVTLGSSWSLGPPVNYWVRIVGTTTAAGLWLVQTFYAASCVSRERERQTLDGLLTLPEERKSVLFAKWLGNVLSTRQGWWCLGVVWGWGVVTGGLHLLSLPLVVLAWAVLTGFVASLGLYWSVLRRTTLQATTWTFVSLLAVLGATWLLAEAAGSLHLVLPPGVAEMASPLIRYGLPLPRPMLVLAFHYGGIGYGGDRTAPGAMLGALGGLLVYAAAAWLLWRAALVAFRKGAPTPSRRRFRCPDRPGQGQ